MRMLRTQSGPFVERPYYEDSDIESITIDELSKVGLLPATPQPIRVDRFIEKRYGIVPQYEDVPDGILGFTRFGAKGPVEVVVSRSLSEEGTRVAERRMNSTLAHEAGHILLHGHLFALERRAGARSFFGDDLDEKKRTIYAAPAALGSHPRERGTRATMGDGGSFKPTRSSAFYCYHGSWCMRHLIRFWCHRGFLEPECWMTLDGKRPLTASLMPLT